MIRVWDGLLSGLCALATIALIGLPLWAAFLAVRSELVPIWFWGPIIVLGFLGIIMVAAFGRKALRGVHPMRDRRR